MGNASPDSISTVRGDRRGVPSLGGQFGWLWAAYAASTFGTQLAFGAFPLLAIDVLAAGPTEVSLLAAAGSAVGAVVAMPLGPWVELRRKRPVMIAADLVRVAALASVPATFALGVLGFGQLLVVAVVVAAAGIAFRAASGACLKSLVPPDHLVVANGRFEATAWTATALGPPLGGAAMGLFGPVVTVLANAVGYLLSAVGIRAMGRTEPRPARAGTARLRVGDLFEGWRYILTHGSLRPLFFNTVTVNGLIMATTPLLATMMLGDLGFAPWQYGLAFGVPCVGGLVGARLARRLVTRHGQRRVLLVAGVLRVCWPVGLAFVGPGAAGLSLVILVELGLITCMGVFNPVFAGHRLDRTGSDRVARTLAAWSITSNVTVAALTALWGLLAGVVGARAAVAIAGVLLLATPLSLPWRSVDAPTASPPARRRARP
nr:MFS transporter [Saccharomonospora cyanea]